MMKVLVKRSSVIAVTLMGLLNFFPSLTIAEESSEETGKMEVKLERIGQNNSERENSGSNDNKETELDKIAPSLFEEQTRAAIQVKQKELENTTELLEDVLFVTDSQDNTALKETEATLFTGDYDVEMTVAMNQNNHNENSEEEGISANIVAGLSGLVLVGCAGLFLMMRKMF